MYSVYYYLYSLLYFIQIIIILLRNDYVCQFYALFIYQILDDVLPGDSKAIGIIGIL